MNKIKEITQKNACIWPIAGCVVLLIMITAVTGSFNLSVIASGAKLCVFALLLGLGQMIVVTSGDGAIDLSQKYILTLTAYVSCTVMAKNVLLGLGCSYYCWCSLWIYQFLCKCIFESACNDYNFGNRVFILYSYFGCIFKVVKYSG